ncbi:hypothetical protein [Olleya namhaensis]|uniref:Tetratricopeptide repeat-containing protein n=1 Tax=Olleya namhaensis TaxID=1144750 RepID=A0A1I3KZ70_9FLAO|nr:hypothetical protein [Olleya namhaensis]SFI77736.1 hypothetical protein SAMN05443431_102174 [Olleya namhaensis]
MTSQELTNVLQLPQVVTAEQTAMLGSILEEFPYFQSARAVFLKGLKNKESFKYNQALRVTAAYTADRSILFDFITSDTFNQNEISEYIKQNADYINSLDVFVEDISVNNTTSTDPTLKQQLEETRSILDPDLFQPKTETQPVISSNLIKNETTKTENDASLNSSKKEIEDFLNIGKPLQFEKDETHSFNEWLNIAKFKPIQREPEDPLKEEANLERAKKFDLIDQFIIKNPKLEAKKAKVSTHNIAQAQMIQSDELMTETLARIYVEQKNYKKAIQSYKILSLKYPEKSGFFADQIKAIEKLQE